MQNGLSLWTKISVVKSDITAKITVILPNFLGWKFCGKGQFPHSFGRITRYYTETVPFHEIFTPEN